MSQPPFIPSSFQFAHDYLSLSENPYMYINGRLTVTFLMRTTIRTIKINIYYPEMKVAVWDTYVTKQDGNIMHFDILVKEGTGFENVQKYGEQYLATKMSDFKALTTEECTFCHIEEASDDLTKTINSQGYSIIEMEGC